MAVERVFRIYWGPTLENALDFAWPVVGSSPTAWRGPRDGSEQAINGASTIGWLTGTYYRYKVTAQYFAGPQYAGGNGLQAFLDWAADSNAFTLVPNLATPGLQVTGCYLEGPFTRLAVSLEGDASQTVELTFLHPGIDLGLAFRGLFFEYAAGGSLTDPVLYSFSRASAGYELNNQGYLTQNPSGTICDGHYPAPLATGIQTTLLSRANTNDVVNPEDLTNATWTKTDVSITANAAKAPDQNLTGDLVVEGSDVGATFHSVVSTSAWSIAAGDSITALCFVRSGGRFKGRVYVSDPTATDRVGVEYDLHAGTISSGATGAGVLQASAITPLSNGWFCLWWRGTVNGTSTTAKFVLTMEDGTGATSYVGDGASGVFLWGVCAVHGPKTGISPVVLGLNDYTPTSAVEDVLTATWTPLPQAMWAYVAFVESGNIAGGSSDGARIWTIGSGVPQIWIEAAAGKYAVDFHNGVTQLSASITATINPGDFVEQLVILYADGHCDFRQSVNGGAEQLASTAAQALPAAWFGSPPSLWFNKQSGGAAGVLSLARFKAGPFTPSGVGAVTTVAQARLA